MRYTCPICHEPCATNNGFENHIWHDHKESRCCIDHKSKATSKDSIRCKGNLDMATCATKNLHVTMGLPWRNYRSNAGSNPASVDSTEGGK